MSKMISVITPSFNSGEFIEKAIKSVLAQNYKNFEHIIIDGGSKDNTLKILKKYRHLKWISEPDKGQSHAMNKGFAISKGEIIVYLNIDDYFLPNAFNSVIPYFDKGEKFVVGNVTVLMEDGSSWENNTVSVKFEDIIRHWRPNAYPVNPVGYFYLREVQEKAGGFNEMSDYTMDLEFLVKASSIFNFKKIETLLGVYRFLEDTKTGRTQSKTNYWTVERFGFLDNHLDSFPGSFRKKFKEEQAYIYEQKNKEINGFVNNKKKDINKIKRFYRFLKNRVSSI